MVAPRFAKLFAVAVSTAFVCSVAGMPAYALTDTNLDGTTGASTGTSAITPMSTDESSSLQNQPSADDAESMPDNPTKDLPQTVSEEIPDDATVVSEELAVTDDGEVMDLETGDTVTDPQIVGTVDKPADPLAKTDGESFIPVEVAEVKDAMGDTATVPDSDDAADTADTEDTGDVAESQQDAVDEGTTGAVVRPAALQNNSYGAHWGTYNGTPAFFETDGTLFVQQAKGVIDVSEWQGQIDWQKAKNDGVEGAIIRISYGWGNGFDKQALRNISECKRLGIPFGIYSYSYAYDSTTAAYEGDDMVSLLRQAGVQPGDLSYPVFYDLEKWTWPGHTPPTSPSVYDGIVNAWYAKLQAAGYNNLSVYSYTNYLDTALNSANIRNKTRWVASYGTRTNFSYATNDRGWQYTSQGSVAGIQGSVDLNAFGNKTYDGNDSSSSVNALKDAVPVTDLLEGDYFIGAASSDYYVDIESGSISDSARALIWPSSNANNQLFHIAPLADGRYSIVATHSSKALDVEAARLESGNSIIQYSQNGGSDQQWMFYRNAAGYVYIVSACGEEEPWAITATSLTSQNGAYLEIQRLTGRANQQFRLQYNTAELSDVTISNVHASGMVLDIKNASAYKEAKTDIWNMNYGDNQRFDIIPIGNGLYNFAVRHSGMMLDVEGASLDNGAHIIQFPSNSGRNQRWYLVPSTNGSFAIINLLNNKAMDVYGMGSAPGTKVISYTYSAQSNQQWLIATVDEPYGVEDMKVSVYGKPIMDLDEGDYYIESLLAEKYIDIQHGSLNQDAPAIIWEGNDSRQQLFHISPEGRGLYTVSSVNSGYYLGTREHSVKRGATVVQAGSGTKSHQVWSLYRDKDGYVYFVLAEQGASGKVLDVTGANPKNGASLEIWDINGGAQQRFILKKRMDTSSAISLRSVCGNGKNLDIANASPFSRAEAIVWNSTGGSNQKFELVHKGNGNYNIRVNHSGLLLDIEGAANRDGSSVIQYSPTGGENQTWYFQSQENGKHAIFSAMNGKVCDIEGAVAFNGAKIITYHYKGTDNQLWML